jgi:hypothetical protein
MTQFTNFAKIKYRAEKHYSQLQKCIAHNAEIQDRRLWNF